MSIINSIINTFIIINNIFKLAASTCAFPCLPDRMKNRITDFRYIVNCLKVSWKLKSQEKLKYAVLFIALDFS